MPGTARASSWPRTSRSTPARGIGSIITPDAAASRRRSPSGSPSAWRRITSSRLTPTPKRSEREHSPPIERAASSSIHTRPLLTRSSAWTGPSRSPSAAQASAVMVVTAATIPPGSRDGVVKIVSSKYGPSSASGLSKTASGSSAPARRRPSTATSAPGT